MACRPWWRNCALEVDPEISEIDHMEDRLGAILPNTLRVRELISTLEICHHKAERWVYNIIQAIGSAETNKGLGSRPTGHCHAAEQVWKNACVSLAAWCAGWPSGPVNLMVGDVSAARLLGCLGQRSHLKEWQVQRVIEKIRSLIGWPHPPDDGANQYTWILFGGGEQESFYRSNCPESYQEHEEFWLATVRTIIRDTADGHDAALSLGLAIDMLWPCHWAFVENLQIVLNAIGGQLNPGRPFAACGRNIGLLPIRHQMATVSNTLRVICGHSEPNAIVDVEILDQIGEPTDTKKWLAASLDKTIRLQLDPSDEMRSLSALSGPSWLSQ